MVVHVVDVIVAGVNEVVVDVGEIAHVVVGVGANRSATEFSGMVSGLSIPKGSKIWWLNLSGSPGLGPGNRGPPGYKEQF